MPPDRSGTGPRPGGRSRALSVPAAAWRRWRNRLLASPRFQRWAARFPLTRPIARRRTRALFDLCAGFVYSQVLMACVRLDLFERLAGEPRTAAELAPALELDTAATRRLLEAAVALDLVDRTAQGHYTLGPGGAAIRGNPAIAAMTEHHGMLYRDLADPLALLRGTAGPTELGRYWGYAGHDGPASLEAGRVGPYSDLMGASQAFVAEQVLDAWRFDRHRHLLDVGGGDGSFALAASARCPSLQVTVLDLPEVAERARRRIAGAGRSGRIDVVGGDFLREPLPTGADVVTLVRVLHDHDDDAAQALLARVRAALPPGGHVVVAEPMADTPGAEPAGGAYFGLYLLAMGSGRPRTPAEITDLLRRTGFSGARVRRTALPLLARVIVAAVDGTA